MTHAMPIATVPIKVACAVTKESDTAKQSFWYIWSLFTGFSMWQSFCGKFASPTIQQLFGTYKKWIRCLIYMLYFVCVPQSKVWLCPNNLEQFWITFTSALPELTSVFFNHASHGFSELSLWIRKPQHLSWNCWKKKMNYLPLHKLAT